LAAPAPGRRDIDEDPSGAQPFAGDFHRLRGREPGVAAVERDVGGVFAS
jgi:hypothetical protein